MKFENGCTLNQLVETYGVKVEIPEILSTESISIYGWRFALAYKEKENWIDDAIETYLKSQEFVVDLRKTEKQWNDRKLECGDYWLELEYSDDGKIHLTVDMDMKIF